MLFCMLQLVGASVASATDLPAHAELSGRVQAWAAAQHGLEPQRIQTLALDRRVQIPDCADDLQMDFPFSNMETVRVRCEQPAWQIFMQLRIAAMESAGSGCAPPASGSPQACDLRTQAARPGSAAQHGASSRMGIVAATHLPRGTLLKSDMLSLAPIDGALSALAVEDPRELIDAELVRTLRPGQAVTARDVRPPVLVRRGHVVVLSIGSSSGLRVSARMESLQDGRMGETVRLKSTESGRVLTGVVTGLNEVQAL